MSNMKINWILSHSRICGINRVFCCEKMQCYGMILGYKRAMIWCKMMSLTVCYCFGCILESFARHNLLNCTQLKQ